MNRRAEVAVGLGAAVFAAGAAWSEGIGAGGMVPAAVVGGALGTARRHPRVSWIVAAAALLAAVPAGVSWGVALLVGAHAFCAGRWEGGRVGIAALAALVGTLELGVLIAHDSVVPALLIPGAGWGAGRALREREVVARQLAERARELEEEREAHAALSVRYERARIASELHDIVAHAISVMVVQASAGQRLADRDPVGTAETFEAIAGAARQAEDDMGRLVALLGDEKAIGPAPDLTLVEELVMRAAGSGLDVTLRLQGERDGFAAPLTQTAYRVVQEGLTNALRYASGAAISVLVRGEPGGLVVEVANSPATTRAALAGSGTGNGLRGLRELVESCGGGLEAGPTSDGGWRVRARLPSSPRVRGATAAQPSG